MPTKKPATKKPATKTTKARKPAAASALRSAALPQKDLVDIGARYNLASLTDHATAVLSKVEEQNAEQGDGDTTEAHFADYGFDSAWVSSVTALLASVAHSGDARDEAASNALPTAAALQTAFTAAKNLRREGVTAVAADPTRTSAMGHLGTGASVPATRRALAKVATLIPPNAVTPSGTGKDFRAKAQATLKALDAAEKAHRTALAKLSPAATRMHAMKGILQQEIKSAARVARTVSPSDAHLFAVESHTHTRTRSRDRAKKPATVTSTPSVATTTATPTAKA